MTPEEKQVKSLVVSTMIDRLETTYQDFITGKRGYDKIGDFFRMHLYSPPNKEARDAALDDLYLKLKSVTGKEMTENIHKLIVLNKLTDELDLETARVLLAGKFKGVDVSDLNQLSLSAEELNEAISEAGRFADREKQIDMVCESLTFFFALSKLPLIRLVLAPIKVAASMVGAMDLVGTMEAGYDLSRGIKDMQEFVDAFTEREKTLIRSLGNATA